MREHSKNGISKTRKWKEKFLLKNKRPTDNRPTK
jgi:hypothetical protein